MFEKVRAFGVAAALTLALGTAASADELRIGALVPTTGDLQLYGETSLNGIRLAVEEINAAGGVLGQPISLRVGDTQTSPQAGVDAAQRMATVEGVHAFVGALSSGVTIPVAQSVSRVQGLAQISGASTSPVITTLDDGDFLFRTVPSDAYQGVALAEIALAEGYKNLSILYINNDYGLGLAESFTAAFAARGGAVVHSASYEPGQSSYRGELRRVSRGDPQGLVLIGYPENGQTIVRQALEGGFFEKFVFTDGLRSPEMIAAIGAEFMDGVIGSSPRAMEGNPGARHFREAYRGKSTAKSRRSPSWIPPTTPST
jgi:branched-chain amino acid transport system substrate-binding protein